MDDVEAHHHIHPVRALLEVLAVVGLFGLAIGCFGCTLNDRGASEGCWRAAKRFCNKLTGRPTDDDDDDSYIGDAQLLPRDNHNNDDGDDEEEAANEHHRGGVRPPAHVFRSLNDLIFFGGSDDNDDGGGGTAGVLVATGGDGPPGRQQQQQPHLLIPTSMEKIFPDLLGNDAEPNEGSGGRDAELREPLL
mmetsp:Transcript_15822/g.36633  ORF Transcript_15822/g.36633 Transcript_15822/m.36633 type:complete len:191 (+) Transcript_15822:119-691(+)